MSFSGILGHPLKEGRQLSIWDVEILYFTSTWRCINTIRPIKNGRHFADDIFKCILLKENVWIPIDISLKDQINDIPAVVQITAWHWPGDKPLSETMMVSFRRIYASLGLNELTNRVVD